jgi:hypothetical protein
MPERQKYPWIKFYDDAHHQGVHQANKRAQARCDFRPVERIPVQLDEAFWKAWRENTAAMKAAGYRVRKDDRSGRWTAWIER